MNAQAPSDADLVRRHLGGDPVAFDDLVVRHRNRIYAVALRICGRREDAMDVTQDVFITVFRKLGSFRGDAQLTTWLHRLTVNAALDLARRRSRHALASLEEVPERPASGPDPEELAVDTERAVAVQRALASLSPEHRAVIVLHDLHDLDYAGIAKILRIPQGTVKSRIHRARVELAGLLHHLEPPAGAGPSNEARDHD